MLNLKIYGSLMFGLLLFACHSKPKVIEGEPVENPEGSMIHTEAVHVHHTDSDVHKVVVKEVLNTERYTYLNVTENEEKFWIAIPRKEVEIGATYYYTGGLLKKNFFSQEFNRIFETVYLVSDIDRQPIGATGSALDEALANIRSGGLPASDEPIEVIPSKGAVSISTLMSNLNKYEGKSIKITGKCVKVNPMIMGRNWVHIKDGSGDMDLTVTTMENVPLGAVVSLEGVIALDKDFGAGYRYAVIMEEAILK